MKTPPGRICLSFKRNFSVFCRLRVNSSQVERNVTLNFVSWNWPPALSRPEICQGTTEWPRLTCAGCCRFRSTDPGCKSRKSGAWARRRWPSAPRWRTTWAGDRPVETEHEKQDKSTSNPNPTCKISDRDFSLKKSCRSKCTWPYQKPTSLISPKMRQSQTFCS